MRNKQLILFLKYSAIAGNIFFILLFLYNSINEGFKVPLAGLIGLLAINTVLFLVGTQQSMQPLIHLLRNAAICGNVLFILFILYNGINEGFKATTVELFRYFGMIALLATNSFLLFSANKQYKNSPSDGN